jgi:hypothetical protein
MGHAAHNKIPVIMASQRLVNRFKQLISVKIEVLFHAETQRIFEIFIRGLHKYKQLVFM